MKFSPTDWVINTRPLSLAAKGAWIDLLCIMWNAQNRGVLQMSIEGYARAIGATVEQTGRVIAELIASRICENITEADGRVTLTCRKMVVDEEIRCERAAGQAEKPMPVKVRNWVGPFPAQCARSCSTKNGPVVCWTRVVSDLLKDFSWRH